ncbi:AmpG family muropeptide MFS transporter [Sphingomonas xanthus]|uniref:AmpG family muropeptide MFS transporter n=1 Tax=Sphingomonas xanthus TaxID=2594473 RepID=A0A516IT12_9SPHN|nr:MFS transporter [Sphingomonas xanthus]QDP20041.1 AmpG family muropeptide MFS transporter [Sphingomonas xanthus]
MATAAIGEQPKGLGVLRAALANRKTAIMLVFGFAAGLPYTLLIGTLNAWLGEWQIDLATIGVLSWIGLAYAFKFLWSPLVDRVRLPLLERLGRRRSWLLLCQLLLSATFLAMAFSDPRLDLGWFALVAVIGAFASATQDVVIDAWRIDVADEKAPVEILSTIYQFGYRIAALVGGALALVLSERISWPTVYAVMGGFMALTIIATLMAPDTPRTAEESEQGWLRRKGAVLPKWRAAGLAIVGTGWVWAIWTVAAFMIRVVTASPNDPNPPAVGDFTRSMGPLIVAATVILPAIVAAVFNWMSFRADMTLDADDDRPDAGARAADHAYSALILPLAELVRRIGWGVIIVLGLILSYRITDNIWGSFAFPFYLQELQYTGDEVAFASKIFGVFMTMAGIALGGILFATIGRMPTLLIGAIVAAASNLLYADLASGAYYIDAFARLFALDSFGPDLRMVRLLIAISGENIAGGLAGAAFVAYLSSITSREFSAVQYALLSSLTFLIGSLGRAAIGEAIDQIGYAPVFRFTAAIGLIAVAFVILEWARTAMAGRREAPIREVAR